MATAIAETNRCQLHFESVCEDYPETSNDPALWEEVFEMSERIVGTGNFPICSPMMGGEDFAYYGAHAPTCFVAVGCRDEATGCSYGLHHPMFKADESAFHIGTALHVAFALEHLAG